MAFPFQFKPALLAASLLLMSGCALHGNYRGLVEVQEARVSLLRTDGGDLVLHHPHDQEQLRHLSGCGLEADGFRLGRHVVVDEWHVTATADGTEPFLGRLEAFGSSWVLHDRNTGRKLVLDPNALGGLVEHEGKIVLVSGYVVGQQTIRVVGFRVLQQ